MVRVKSVRLVPLSDVHGDTAAAAEKRINELLAGGFDLYEVNDGVLIMAEWEELPEPPDLPSPEPAGAIRKLFQRREH